MLERPALDPLGIFLIGFMPFTVGTRFFISLSYYGPFEPNRPRGSVQKNE